MHYLLSHWASCVRSLKLWSLPIWPQCRWLPPRAFPKDGECGCSQEGIHCANPCHVRIPSPQHFLSWCSRECNSAPRGCVSRTALTAVSPPYAAFSRPHWSPFLFWKPPHELYIQKSQELPFSASSRAGSRIYHSCVVEGWAIRRDVSNSNSAVGFQLV